MAANRYPPIGILLIAPLMVRHAAMALVQELESLPVGATYQVALLKEKFAGGRPGMEAVTLKLPSCQFAVNVEAVATPLTSVMTEVVFVPFAKVPPGPDAGAVKLTVTPDTGLPWASKA